MVFFSWRPMTQFIGPTGGGVTSVDWIRQEDSDTQKALLERFPFWWKGELWEPSCLVIFALGLFEGPDAFKRHLGLVGAGGGAACFFFLVPWLGWRQKKINLPKQWARKSPKDKPNICNLIRTCDLKVNVISYARCAPKNLSCASMGKNNRTAL